MKIRSITSFLDPSLPGAAANLDQLAEFSRQAQKAIENAGIEVQSTRLATSPFPFLVDCRDEPTVIQRAVELDQSASAHGYGYVSFGPALPEFPPSYDRVPAMLAATSNLFLCGVIADSRQVYPEAIRAAAGIIHAAANTTPDGFTNLRFAAIANVKPGGPFLPGAYHSRGASPAFSLAVECADAALLAFKSQSSLSAGCAAMLDSFERFASQLDTILTSLAEKFKVSFNGFDFSPAPFPEDSCSLGGTIEAIGAGLGKHGSLAAAAVIADALGRGNWKHAGYNGLMLPVLEDSVLATRAAEGALTVQDLLMYSAVCGTGLDTVPLSGSVTVEQLESVLMDVAALAVRLGKPLTARLMPIPGKKPGDPTEFSFGFFKNSKVMNLDGQTLKKPLFGNEPIYLTPRIPD